MAAVFGARMLAWAALPSWLLLGKPLFKLAVFGSCEELAGRLSQAAHSQSPGLGATGEGRGAVAACTSATAAAVVRRMETCVGVLPFVEVFWWAPSSSTFSRFRVQGLGLGMGF